MSRPGAGRLVALVPTVAATAAACWGMSALGLVGPGVAARAGAGLGAGFVVALAGPLIWPTSRRRPRLEALVRPEELPALPRPPRLQYVELVVRQATMPVALVDGRERLAHLLGPVLEQRLGPAGAGAGDGPAGTSGAAGRVLELLGSGDGRPGAGAPLSVDALEALVTDLRSL